MSLTDLPRRVAVHDTIDLSCWRGPADANFRQVLADVSDVRGVSVYRIMVNSRTDWGAKGCRALIALILREVHMHSYPEIALALGVRAHSTVIRMIRGLSTELVKRFAIKVVSVDPVPMEKLLPPPPAVIRANAPAVREAEALISQMLNMNDDRRAFDKAVLCYWNAPAEKRDRVWRLLCRAMFPNSWENQASMPPSIYNRPIKSA